MSLLGLSVIVGGVANAGTFSEFIPSILATRNDVSLAMIVDPSVFGVLGALGFFILTTLRRNGR